MSDSSNAIHDMNLTQYGCPACGGIAVAKKGALVLCQKCVTQYLASKVGLMEEKPEEPESDS